MENSLRPCHSWPCRPRLAHRISAPLAHSSRTAGTAEGGERVSFDIGRLALVAIAVALWVAVFQGFNAF